MNKLTIVFGLVAFFTACGDDDGRANSTGGAGGVASGGKNSGGTAGKSAGGTAGMGGGGKHSGGAGMAGGGTDGGSPGAGAGAGGTAGEGGGGKDAGGAGAMAGEGGAGGHGSRVFGSLACAELAGVAPCDSSGVAYAFNATTKKCELVPEGLCTGSGHHFASESECQAACPDVPHCPSGVGPDPSFSHSCDGYQKGSSCWVEYNLYPDGTSCTCGSTWVCAL